MENENRYRKVHHDHKDDHQKRIRHIPTKTIDIKADNKRQKGTKRLVTIVLEEAFLEFGKTFCKYHNQKGNSNNKEFLEKGHILHIQKKHYFS